MIIFLFQRKHYLLQAPLHPWHELTRVLAVGNYTICPAHGNDMDVGSYYLRVFVSKVAARQGKEWSQNLKKKRIISTIFCISLPKDKSGWRQFVKIDSQPEC